MNQSPYILPSTPDRWDAWESSFQAEQELDSYTHESGYGLSPMEQLDADLMAFDMAWARFWAKAERCADRVTKVLLCVSVVVIVLPRPCLDSLCAWVAGALGGPGQ